MANQAIALQARAPQMTGLSNAIQQNAQMINMMAQQKAAERQAAQAQQAMQLAQAEEVRKARLAEPQFAKASSEALSAQMKAANDFLDFSIEGMKMARNPEDAVKIGGWLKSQFPQAEFQQAVDQTLSSLPQDPSQFNAWREQTLFQSMDAKDQLAQEFTTQNLGTSTRVLATPKYGTGAGRVVQGSEAEVAFKPTVVNVEGVGAMVVDPNTGVAYPAATGQTGGFTRSQNVVGGPRGGGTVAGGNTFERMVGIESGGNQFSKAGAPLTSPKGAVGIAQVMPGTAPEAAALAGLAYDENRYRNDAQYNLALGKAYYQKQLADFGDERLAAAAYNAGPGAVRRALKKGGPTGWENHIPRETRDYITKLFGGSSQRTPAAPGGGAPMTTEQAASAQEKQRKVKTFQELTGVNLESGEDPVAALIKGSTSGIVEAFGAELLGAIPEQLGGGATKGMEKIGALETIASTLTLAFAPGGRLSTGVSNEDRIKIEQQLGRIEDPKVPAGKRLAAWKEVKAIMARSIGITPKATAPKAAPRPSPKPAPRRTAGGANVSDW